MLSIIVPGSPYDIRTTEPISISDVIVIDPSALLATGVRSIVVSLCS